MTSPSNMFETKPLCCSYHCPVLQMPGLLAVIFWGSRAYAPFLCRSTGLQICLAVLGLVLVLGIWLRSSCKALQVLYSLSCLPILRHFTLLTQPVSTVWRGKGGRRNRFVWLSVLTHTHTDTDSHVLVHMFLLLLVVLVI